MKDQDLKRKNGTSTHYPKKEKISLKKEWWIAEDRVYRFLDWMFGNKGKGGE